ncbi:MAG: photosynthetic reaction center cytochrome c subunit [Blastocatellia bacterium]|nr:photosynthetic reaction center cytochrome c subunit [Blastocatellia bacterium]
MVELRFGRAIMCAVFVLAFVLMKAHRVTTGADRNAKESAVASSMITSLNEVETTQQKDKPDWQDEAIAEIRKKIAGRENEPAEKVFRDIETFKGIAASRLPGAMIALTGLIGVDCAYCHVKDEWEKNDKPAKLTARKHFQMQDEILEKYFDKKNKVSCWTCHRGQPNAELLPQPSK